MLLFLRKRLDTVGYVLLEVVEEETVVVEVVALRTNIIARAITVLFFFVFLIANSLLFRIHIRG